MAVKERLEQLREAMRAAGISCYVIPTSDYHDSESVSEHFMARKYFSGFTGSAGTLAVTMEEAALFTDGRYFIQAEKELRGSGIKLMKAGEPGVPTLPAYLKQVIEENGILGYDGRTVTAKAGRSYEEALSNHSCLINCNIDLAEAVWKERPKLVHKPVFLLPQCYSGEGTESKLIRLREQTKAKQVQCHIITALDDIAWLCNIRGRDVKSCPVVLAFAAITEKEAILFAEEEAFDKKAKEYLKDNHICLMPYEAIYEYASQLPEDSALWICEDRINYRLKREINPQVRILNRISPVTEMKAVKNSVEINNLRIAHLKDGIAMTQFMLWLKDRVGKEELTEIGVTEHLEKLRKEQEHFWEPSFDTICAYGEHGAIIHYSASEESNAILGEEGLLMVDSGGHYLEGSTDITRTYVMGSITTEMKQHFTLVVRAMLNLESACFLYGCCGANLDMLARGILWEQRLDYKHGTGHGVGYLLNIHEGPNGFRWKIQGGEQTVLEAGMVTTDEPGIYVEGSHGIRIENELLCQKEESNQYGQFMSFEDLTCVPIDLDGIDAEAMSVQEVERLNRYHRNVYQRLSPYFEGEQLEKLKIFTKGIGPRSLS